MSIVLPPARPAMEPWLVYDARKQLAGKPGLHVLIAGVSAYPKLPSANGLGMVPLSSTSLTAYLMFYWLLNASQNDRLEQPLATCRLLLTPSAEERSDSAGHAPGIAALAPPNCSMPLFRDAAEAWRNDAATNKNHSTLFYFAGHGIQITRNNQALLLDSFGDTGPVSMHSVDCSVLRNGMAPSLAHPDIARTQFYFVDACRNLPPANLSLENVRAGDVFQVHASGLDDRRAPIFFASPPDGKAQAVPRVQTLFSIALLRCLAGRAAFPPDRMANGRAANHWYVSTQSIAQGLPIMLEEVNREYGGQQSWTMDGGGNDAVLTHLSGTPIVPLQIEVDPERALGSTTVDLKLGGAPAVLAQFRSNRDSHPFRRDVPAGIYEIGAVVNPKIDGLREADQFTHTVEPLRCRTKVKLS
ncbi:hypothetical protein ACWTU6_19800 [Mesorhizobium sp. BHbsci]